jgi:mono/diheme cytochrome c family protein
MTISLSRTGLALAAAGIGLLIASSPADAQASKATKARIDRGMYLVKTGGCGDCHSPKVMGPQGPVEHPTLALSGHQAGAKVPDVPAGVLGPDKWGAITTPDLTAWAGPWGVSFAANLTPDPGTGIGAWNETMFLSTLRNGKHLGRGRALLPPMPWQSIGQMTDQDLKDVFAYLMSLKPVENKVPDPIPPKQ